MEAFYIGVKKNTGEQLYLDIDQHSGGYPYWSKNALLSRRFNSMEDVSKKIDSIKRQFKVKSGENYNDSLFVDTLSIIHVGVIETIHIDIESETQAEKDERILSGLKSKLNPEELELINRKEREAIFSIPIG